MCLILLELERWDSTSLPSGHFAKKQFNWGQSRSDLGCNPIHTYLGITVQPYSILLITEYVWQVTNVRLLETSSDPPVSDGILMGFYNTQWQG